MSGVNRLINSENTITGDNLEGLKRDLAGNANEEAARITEYGMKYKSGAEPVHEATEKEELYKI